MGHPATRQFFGQVGQGVGAAGRRRRAGIRFRAAGLGRVLLAGLAAGTTCWTAAGQGVFVERPGVMEFTGELIVRPEAADPSSAESRARYQRALETIDRYEVLDHESALDCFLIEIPEGETEESLSRRLMGMGLFDFVEPNWRGFPQDCPNEGAVGGGTDDFDAQWHHRAIESCRGWDLHTGDPTTVIAFVDTGIRTTHEDLTLNRRRGYDALARCWESVGPPCEVGPMATDGSSMGGNAGHGTGTTGAAVATGNNGVGIAGVGWNLGHRMMRVTPGDAFASYCITLFPVCHAAIVAAQEGDRVVSVQVGLVYSEAASLLGTVLRDEYDTLLVWSAGNGSGGSPPLDTGHRDADDIIIVGGIRQNDGSFGTIGPSVDLVAPAVGIRTTAAFADTGYGTFSGTSYSGPIAAGLCGLIRSYDPSLSADQTEFILKAGVRDVGQPGQDDTFGYGCINVHNSLRLVATRLGMSACATTPNSVGDGATFLAFGSPKVIENDLRIRCTGLPAGAAVSLIVGSELVDTPLGDGHLCAGGDLVRRRRTLRADADGLLEHSVDLASPHFEGLIVPGASTVLQLSYRDPDAGPAGFNLSNGVQIDWY